MGVQGCGPVGAGARLQQVSAVEQDVLDMAVFAGAQAEGHGAGRFQPDVAVALAQIEQAQAGTVGMLGVALALEHLCHHASTGHAVAPVQDLDRVATDAQLQRQAHEGMGDALAVTFKLDVAVDVHAHRS